MINKGTYPYKTDVKNFFKEFGITDLAYIKESVLIYTLDEETWDEITVYVEGPFTSTSYDDSFSEKHCNIKNLKKRITDSIENFKKLHNYIIISDELSEWVYNLLLDNGCDITVTDMLWSDWIYHD